MFIINVYSNSQLIHAGVPVTGKVSIGRDPVNDLVIPENSVSRRHMTLGLLRIGMREVLILTDEASRNGTFVNSQRIEERIVAPGDLVRFGCCRLEILEVETSYSASRDISDETIHCRIDPATDLDTSGRLRALFSMALSLSELEIPFMLERAAEIVRTCVEYDQFCILLQGSREMVPCTCWNRLGPCAKNEILFHDAILENALKVGQPFVSNNLRTDGRLTGEEAEGMAPVTAVSCIPLRSECRVLGLLYCTVFDSRNSFTHEDIYFLTLVACFVASGISYRRNLSHAQKNAARLEAILASLQEGVVVCDSDFRILSANDAARRIFSRKSLVGLRFDEVLNGFVHTFDEGATRMDQSFTLERYAEPDPETGRCPEIEAYHATVSSAAGQDTDGWLRIVCIRDVTQERRSQLMQIAFVNRLAHKLRTPLTVVGGAVSFMNEKVGDSPDTELREMLGLAQTSSEQLAGLIDRFIEFTAMDEHDQQLRSSPTPVPLTYLISQTLTLAAEHTSRDGLNVTSLVEESSWQLIVVPEKICQCFLQLVHNACKFAGAGATLTVDAVEDGGGLSVRFTDDGPGISKAELERVFDLFHQVDHEGTGEVPGVGLGLWWTREVVRVHGGEVRITSPVRGVAGDGGGPRGTRVEVIFPPRLVVRTDASEVDRKETRELADAERELELNY